MQATLAELAALVDGRLIGDGSLAILGAAPLADARPGEITLIDRPERIHALAGSLAAAVVAPPGDLAIQLPMIQVEDVRQAFAEIVSRFRPPRARKRVGISPEAVISPTATIGPDVDIHPLATIGDDVQIGRGTIIHSGARIMAGRGSAKG